MNTEIITLLTEQTSVLLAMTEEIKGLRADLKVTKRAAKPAPIVTDGSTVTVPEALCQAKTKTDKPCTFKAKEGSSYCGRHKNYDTISVSTPVVEGKTCEALTKTNKPCAAKAKEGSRYCGRHKNYDPTKRTSSPVSETVVVANSPVSETGSVEEPEPVIESQEVIRASTPVEKSAPVEEKIEDGIDFDDC